MSNTLTNTDPEIIVNECLPAFKAGLAPVNAFSTSYASTVAQPSASIQVPVITAKSANTAGFSTYEDGDTTIVGVQVTLDQRPRSFSHLTDLEAGKTPVDVIMAQSREDAYAVGISVFQGVIGLIVAGTFGDVANTSKLVVTSANYDVRDLSQARKLLRKRNALGAISAIHDLDYGAAVIEDNNVLDASALGSTEGIREGAIGRLVGMSIYETNGFPTALTNENTGVVLTVPSAIALAIRPITPQSGSTQAGTQFATATDPETGLTLGYRRFYNNATGTYWHGFEVLWGATAVQTEGAVRVVSA